MLYYVPTAKEKCLELRGSVIMWRVLSGALCRGMVGQCERVLDLKG